MITTSASTSTTPYEELAADLYGELIRPGDPGYDEARAVYNAMIDKHPAAIARCRDSVDVISCVRFGREHGLEIAVRGGGHNAAGLGVWDNALVIDLSLLRSTTVDAENRTVRVDAGCTWRDVDHATVGFGMATPSGFLGSTGVGGLTLGGGIGYLSRRFGLTVDNLLSADVVLADGTFVTASANSHSDLFWALRGGGGNFGVVTSFTFRCHDIGERGAVIAGPVLYDVADTADVMRWYREIQPSLPEDGSGWLERKLGFTHDQLISIELVTAAGEIVTASREERPELFWGVRGGGGNFGIVTSSRSAATTSASMARSSAARWSTTSPTPRT